MVQGRFTKEEAEATKEAVEGMFDGIPKSRRMNFIGHLNDIMLFLEAAKKVAPEEE